MLAQESAKLCNIKKKLKRLKQEAAHESSLPEQIKELEKMIIEEQEKYYDLEKKSGQMILEDPFGKKTDAMVDIFVQQMVKLDGMKNKLKRLKREAAGL